MSWLWRLFICFPSKVTAQLHITISNNQEVSHNGLPLLPTLIYSSLVAAKVIQKITHQTIWKVAFETKSGSFLHNTFKLGFPKGLLHFLLLETKSRKVSPFLWNNFQSPAHLVPKAHRITNSHHCFLLPIALCASVTMPYAQCSYINVISRATMQRNSCYKKVKSPSVILV